MNTTTRRNAAAIRVALAHLDPRPLTGEWMMRRLRDVVTIHDLPGWRADTGADPDGQTWAAISWRRPRGEYTVRVALTRYAPRNLSARVGRIRELEAAGRLDLTVQAHTPPPTPGPRMYRKKPAVVEAMRLTGTPADCHAVMSWMDASGYPFLVGDALKPETLRYRDQDPADDSTPDKGIWIDPATGTLMVRTLEGDMSAPYGHWIIRGIRGEFYPCHPAIFAATYKEGLL